jgi:7-cyano-7-deazaguanine synthase in queuosine biosynthesis
MMNMIKLSGIDIMLYDDQTPIGVSLSGGADSAVLAFILMKYSKSPIHFITLGSKQKNYTSVKHSVEVLQKCVDLTGNFNVTHHVAYTYSQERDSFFKLLIDNVDSSLVSIVYTGTTQLPPTEDLLKFKHKLSPDLISRRDPNITSPTFSHHNKLYHPFLNCDKKDIKQLYQDLGILDSLFPITRSCIAMERSPNHCGNCWWCEERLWAFDKLS